MNSAQASELCSGSSVRLVYSPVKLGHEVTHKQHNKIHIKVQTR
jgi:hypothetical protein